MRLRLMVVGVLAAIAFIGSLASAEAETDLEKAVQAGAKQLTADEIADLIVGKTVTAQSGSKKFLFYYSPDNVLIGKLIGGAWSDKGYYGITNDNRVCLSISKDKGRLRCLTLLSDNVSVKKYNVAGKMTFELLEFKDGNLM